MTYDLTYDFKSLLDLLKPHKTYINDIKPLSIVMKNEHEIFMESSKYKDSLFIGVGNKSNVSISREICLNKDHQGGLITNNERIYRSNSLIYSYNEKSLEIITRWYTGYKTIQRVSNEIVDFNIDTPEKFKEYLNTLKENKGD